ncbi:MAG: metallophosphoesterase [Anaerolineales bacterium]|nr:metallophosphoesterase [Anaerolineales bacterium]
MPILPLPDPALLVLIGPHDAQRSAWAKAHFAADEIVALADCRRLVADEGEAAAAGREAVALLDDLVARRLAVGSLTVVDAPHLTPGDRQPLVALAKRYHLLPVALVFGAPDPAALAREGFRRVLALDTAQPVTLRREPLPPNRRDLSGPFDLIGDVHGCFDELLLLLEQLGYHLGERVTPPPGRTAVFVGDLVDRGPRATAVLALVMGLAAESAALCVAGNHDNKLLRQMQGRHVHLTHGLAESVAQLARETPEFRARVLAFLGGLTSHYVLDSGRLVVAHGGLKESLHGRDDLAVREFSLYGATTGATDALGLPVRLNWAADYHGAALVVYGHTPVAEPLWQNNTVNLDTGCVFGGRLSALRYPERQIVAVPALRRYAEPRRPFLPSDSQG